jgi:hypothetical protein
MTKALTAHEALDASNGTSLRGYVKATRAEIEAVFGAPTWDDGDVNEKVTTEWVIRFDSGVVATIYDWKRYELGKPETEERIEWNIGGHDAEAWQEVSVALWKPAYAF